MKTTNNPMKTNDMIMSAALQAGFQISTGYGQEENKLMPASDLTTLGEFAKIILNARTEEIVAMVEEMPENKYMTEAGELVSGGLIPKYLVLTALRSSGGNK